MSDFKLWFLTGLEHILDLSGYDHILYVTLLALAYPPAKWDKLLILITGFTLGHSCSLALSVINNLRIPQPAIEALIALSIFITALFQLRNLTGKFTGTDNLLPAGAKGTSVFYLSTVIFGLVHGLGFSFLLRAMLGSADSVFLPLLYFNLGLECGQLIIVGIILLFSLILKLSSKKYLPPFKTTIICSIALVSMILSVQRIIQLF
jgi:hypothetical protein